MFRVASKVTTTAAMASALASSHLSVARGSLALRSTSSTGVTTSTPIASPIHHAAQTGQKSRRGSRPVAASVPQPMVALTSIAAMAPRNTRVTPSRSRSSSGRKPTLRSSRNAQTGARVLPAEMVTPGSVMVLPTVAMESRAPTAIPGQTRSPM